jgi:hypothetical protein
MARQGKPKLGSAPVTLSQLRYAFMAYRRSVGDYHSASLGADSAHAVGVIEETYASLVRLASKVPGLSMPPRPVARWHGDWSDGGRGFTASIIGGLKSRHGSASRQRKGTAHVPGSLAGTR